MSQKKIQLLQRGIPVSEWHWRLQQHPELWNQNRSRTQDEASPHYGLDDIWIRYGSPDQDPTKPHDAKWHASADTLEIKRVCMDIMHFVGGCVMGGVLITRIPPGFSCKPHEDSGWHADVHEKFALQIASAPGQTFHFEDEELETRPGDLFTFQNQHMHWVTNPTAYERITLIVCVKKE